MAAVAAQGGAGACLSLELAARRRAGWIGRAGAAVEESQRLRQQGFGELVEPPPVDGDALRPGSGHSADGLEPQAWLDQALDAPIGPPSRRCETAQTLHHARIPGLEPGQETGSDRVPRGGVVVVGRIVDRLEAGAAESPVKVGAAAAEERPDQPAADPRHGAETVEAAAEEKPQEHSLSLIVGVVGGGDETGAEAVGEALEEGVAMPAGEGLGALAAGPSRPEPLRGQGHVDSGRQASRSQSAPRRVVVEAVIEVGRVQAQARAGGDPPQPPKQCGRVGAAGEGHQHQIVAAGDCAEESPEDAGQLPQRLLGVGGGEGT